MSTLSVATIKSASSASPVFQNSSGTEKGQLCKAWINFNGSGTVSIVGSFNVSSLTDNGTGTYTQTLTNPFSNITFIIITGIGELGGGGNRGMGINGTPTTTTTKFYSFTFPSSGGTNANDVDLQSAAWQGDLA